MDTDEEGARNIYVSCYIKSEFDSLFKYTTDSFFLKSYSYVYDDCQDNMERCMQNVYSIFENQSKKHVIVVHGIADIMGIIAVPKNIINLATDTFWNAWTFIIGHGLL